MSDTTLIEDLAKLLTGLQVPLSMPGNALGAAEKPLIEIREKLDLFGWPDADEHLTKLNRRLHEDIP